MASKYSMLAPGLLANWKAQMLPWPISEDNDHNPTTGEIQVFVPGFPLSKAQSRAKVSNKVFCNPLSKMISEEIHSRHLNDH